MVAFSHMIFYVRDIPGALSFYEKAFGILPKFVHEGGLYAELNTGTTTLAFAAESLGKENLPSGYTPHDKKSPPLASEIVFTVEDVSEQYNKAVSVGATALCTPKEMPWGQTVAYVRDPNGVLIEIAGHLFNTDEVR